MSHQGYGFCEFLTEDDAEYACKIMNQIKLWGKPIRVNKVRVFCAGYKKGLTDVRARRPRRTRSNSTLARTCSLATWTRMLMNGYYTTRSLRSVSCLLLPRCALRFQSSTLVVVDAPHISGCARPQHLRIQRSRIRLLCRLRVFRCRHREYERPVSHE